MGNTSQYWDTLDSCMINHSDCISESIHIGDQFAFSDQSDELHPECSFFHNAVCFLDLGTGSFHTNAISKSQIQVSESGGSRNFPYPKALKFPNPRAWKFPNPCLRSFRIRGTASFRIRRPGSFRIRGLRSFRIRGAGSFRIRGPRSFRIRGP